MEKKASHLKTYIMEYLKVIVISLVVVYGWQLLEIIMIGHVNSNKVDTVIAIILILSLYGNLRKRSKVTIKIRKNPDIN